MIDADCLIDTNLLIQHLRQPSRTNALRRSLAIYGVGAISIITQLEYETGEIAAGRRSDFARQFSQFAVLPLTDGVLRRVPYVQAHSISLNKRMDYADLLIAATAAYHKIPLLTLNVEHFRHLGQFLRLLKVQ